MDKGKELVGEDGGYASQTGSEAEEEEEEEVVVQPQVTVEGTTGVKRWVVDLDLPPEERWSEVVAFHAPDLLAVAQHIRSELARMVGKKKATFGEKVVGAFLAGAAHAGVVFYGRELAGIAKASGLPLGQLVLLQLVYEASAACTSIVVPQDPTQDSTPQHIRTMDWGMEFLKPLTIEVDFVKGGRSQYVATTWVGYVGVLTGMRPFGYSVSVNFRVTSGAYWKNVKKAILRAWPIGFLGR